MPNDIYEQQAFEFLARRERYAPEAISPVKR